MRKTTIIEILLIFLIGLVPLLWFRQGYIISNGDNFPIFLNPQNTSTVTYLWSFDSMGYASQWPCVAIYQYIAFFFSCLGMRTGAIQILFQVFFFMGAGFSMYYLSKVVYPNLRISPLIASFFYMFNFFVLETILNVGFAWSYTFLPLLIALLIQAINASYKHDNKVAHRYIIYFAISSTIALSLARINPANVALIFLGIATTFLYYLLKNWKQLKVHLVLIGKILLVIVPINLWWLLPTLNAYVFSPQVLNSQINVVSWSWTQDRSSFLNLFWLNGIWTWSPEYFPYFGSYSNPLLTIVVFIPFLLATIALLFKSSKSGFNAYIMLSILFFMFLAKGLHEPLSQLNLLISQIIPYMNMFREPTSKFTILIVLFLALLIGYAADHLLNLKALNSKRIIKIALAIFLIATFVIAAFPLVTNPIETKTQDLPFSAYVKIPNYWIQATNWINGQNGDYSVLITPLDDFYQMPYTWGYYGTDQLIDQLFQKPIISTDYLNWYYVNPDTTANLQQLQTAIKYNNTAEFKAFLDLFNVKYIVQRDDIEWNLTGILAGRQIMSPTEMQTFLSQQSYLHLVEEFGQLKIYEYTESKPSLYIVSPQKLQQYDVSLLNMTEVDQTFLDNTESQSATILNYQTISPTEITATVNASQPFILATSQALDRSWVAYVNGVGIKPIPLYLGLSGFMINKTGQFDVTIEYEPQLWFYYCSAISVSTLILCLLYLILPYLRTKQLFNKIGLKKI